MRLHHLEHEEWKRYMDLVSRTLPPTDVQISIEDELLVGRARLIGLAYDRGENAFQVIMESFCHTVRGPIRVDVEQLKGSLRQVTITDQEGDCHRIRLARRPPMPAA